MASSGSSTPPTASATPRVAVVTPVRGRLDHLVNQRLFLVETAPEALHVVVAVDMPDLEDGLNERGAGDAASVSRVGGGARCSGPGGLVIEHLDDDPLGMPTAKARNVGAARALAEGADLLVFLDVDCVPLPGMIDALVAASGLADPAPAPAVDAASSVPQPNADSRALRTLRDSGSGGGGCVLNAVVTYLPEGAPLDDEAPSSAQRFIAPHPVRLAPADGEVVVDDAHHLLWSLAFALTADAWRACGGFDEVYVGYGAEDTDFGMRARAAGLPMAWVGGAHALHQWHPSENPPTHHVVDIVRNANLYRDRWGAWPMEGWLRAFADKGLVVWDDDDLRLA